MHRRTTQKIPSRKAARAQNLRVIRKNLRVRVLALVRLDDKVAGEVLRGAHGEDRMDVSVIEFRR